MTLIQPVRLSEKIKPLLDLKTKEERLSRSVVIKQFVYEGLEEYALKLCERGRLSIGRAAEILDMGIYDLQEMAKDTKNQRFFGSLRNSKEFQREKGIILSAGEEAAEKSSEVTKKFIRKLKPAK